MFFLKKKFVQRFIAVFCGLLVCTSMAFSQAVPEPAAESTEAPKTPEKIGSSTLQVLKLKIMQKGTGQPLRKVEVVSGSAKTFSDPNGEAKIEIPNDAKEINIVRVGFESINLVVDEYKDTLELDVFMYPKLGADDEVIIKGKRRPSVSKKVITAVEAAKVAPGGDPGQVTKLMPGVTSSPGRSDVSIRGSEPNDSLYRIDDIELPFIYHSVGSLTVVPPSTIDDVEFSGGGFGPEYGDATGGVVVVKTKVEIPDRPITRFTLNLPIYSSVFHERPLSENSAMSVGVRRSYLEVLLPKVLPKDSGVTLIPFFSDYQGSWVSKSEDGHKKLTLLASSDGIKATVPSQFSEDENGAVNFFLKTYFGAIAFERSKKLSNDWNVVTTPQWVYTDNQFNVNDLRFRVKVHNFRVPTEFTKRISSTERLYAGFDLGFLPYEVSLFLPRFDPDDPFYDVQEAPKIETSLKGNLIKAAGWLARDFQLADWNLTPGMRLFHLNQNKSTGIDPRFQGRKSMGPIHTSKFAVGQYSQFPKNGEAAKDFGNPELKNTRAYHYILGIESKWDDRWETDFQVFYKDVYDVIQNDSVKNYDNDGQLRSKGFEVFIRRAMTERWFGWVAYTWSKAEQRKSKEAEWYPGDNDQTHILNVAGNYKWSATWETGGRYTSHTGDTYTSTVGPAVYNSNLNKYQPRSNPDEINNARLPHYNELGIYSAHDFLFDTSKMTFRWGLEYLWFKRQTLNTSANYDYSKEEPSQGVPPIPYLELRGEL
ncbi:MAG: TonB-dependent receptor plug domain-containing protein [Proteobacteria bacterium]|nr:TonB-dependent receptor plug domain-containing protein [Pseudomonadota bacterium]